jgi:hypothetical protein
MNVGVIRRLTTEARRNTEDAQRELSMQTSVPLCASVVNCLVPYTQLNSDLGAPYCMDSLLVPQRDHRVDARRPPRRDVTGYQ